MHRTNHFILAILVFASSLGCRKDPKICNNYTQISGQANLVDVSILKGGAQEFLDTLAKYPQLQAYRIYIDSNGYTMQCHIFYKGLIIFTAYYMLDKSTRFNFISASDSVITTIPGINLTPSITSDAAIAAARQNENFNNTCISYQLGIYDINCFSANKPKNYRLVWQIEGTDSGYPIVVIDANNSQVYYKDDGIVR